MRPATMLMILTLVASCEHAQDPQSCTARGGSCEDGLECCGDDVCSGRRCSAPEPSCSLSGEQCRYHTDCCDFQSRAAYCVDSVCKDVCSSKYDCLTYCCAPTSVDGLFTCADPGYCSKCLSANSFCTDGEQCCGVMPCSGGRCGP